MKWFLSGYQRFWLEKHAHSYSHLIQSHHEGRLQRDQYKVTGEIHLLLLNCYTFYRNYFGKQTNKAIVSFVNPKPCAISFCLLNALFNYCFTIIIYFNVPTICHLTLFPLATYYYHIKKLLQLNFEKLRGSRSVVVAKQWQSMLISCPVNLIYESLVRYVHK